MVRTEEEIYLETYSLEEIIEMNDLTDEDVLSCLVQEGLVTLTNKPVDIP